MFNKEMREKNFENTFVINEYFRLGMNHAL